MLGLIRRHRTAKEWEKEFDRLYLEHHKEVFCLAMRLVGDEEAAEDIRQKTFLTLHRKLKKVVDHPNQTGWFIKTVQLFVKHYWREQAYRAEHEVYVESIEEIPGPLSTRDELSEFLDCLPVWLNDGERELLVLAYFYGFTLRDIGNRLGFTHGAVRSRMARLHKKMQEHGYDKNKQEIC